jgi:hypothetical protein
MMKWTRSCTPIDGWGRTGWALVNVQHQRLFIVKREKVAVGGNRRKRLPTGDICN